MQICLIWAQSQEGAIGKDNQLPWHLPEDLAHFKQLTVGCPVIMGRRTWESLPRKPLPGRMNIVLTSQAGDTHIDDAALARGLSEALSLAKAQNTDRCFIIGGEGVYREALPYADLAFITHVHVHVPGADAFAPCLPKEWALEASGEPKTSASGLGYRFERWALRF